MATNNMKEEDLNLIFKFTVFKGDKDVYTAVWNNKRQEYIAWHKNNDCGHLSKRYVIQCLKYKNPWVIVE